MLACDWNGHSYSASTILAAAAMAASALPCFTGSWRAIGLAARIWSYSAALPGNGGAACDQVTFSLPGGTDRVPFARRRDAQEALLPYDVDAGNVGDRRFIDGGWYAAGNGGADHARVQHAGQADVGDELVPGEDVFGDVGTRDRGTDDAVIARAFRLGAAARDQPVAIDPVPLHRHVEMPVADQLGIADLSGRIGNDRDYAVPHVQGIGGNAEALGR